MEDEYGFEVPQMQWYDESKNPYVRGYEAPANMVEQASAPLPDDHELYPDYDFSELKTTNNRPVNSDYLNYIYKKLRKAGFDDKHASVLLGQIAEESGGDPFAVDATGTYNGLLQWAPDRYQINTFYDDDPYKEINRQLKYLLSTIDDLDDGKSWTHGGSGSGYNSRKDAYADWIQDEDMGRMNRGLSFGHVRPTGKAASARNRFSVGSQIYDTITAANSFADGGGLGEEPEEQPWSAYQDSWHNYALAEIQADIDSQIEQPQEIVAREPQRVERTEIASPAESVITQSSMLRDAYAQQQVPSFTITPEDMAYQRARETGGYSMVSAPYMDAVSRSNAIVRDVAEQDVQEKVRGLSSGEDLKELQTKLVEQGYYGTLEGSSKEDIRRVQRDLIAKGYLSDRTRSDGSFAEVDGILGPKTRGAYKKYLMDTEVDGVVGNKTRRAAEAYFNQAAAGKSAEYRSKIRQGVDGCARFVRQTFEDRFGDAEAGGLSNTDAWQMPMSIVKNGGQLLYNIYDSGDFNKRMTKDTLSTKSKQLTQENPIDLSILQEGDVVGMYVPGSHAMDQAISNGTTFNTHVGLVVGHDKDGMPLIADNVSKHGRVQRADRLGNFRITVAARPNKYESGMDASRFMSPTDRRLRLKGDGGNDVMQSYLNGVDGAKDYLSKVFPMADPDSAALLAGAVQKRETNYMTRRQSDVTGTDKIMAEARKFVNKNKDQNSVSTNNGKLKLTSFTNSERSMLGIRSREDLEKPEIAGRAAMYLMMKYNDYFRRLAAQYPSLELTDDDINALTAMSFNQGPSKLMSQGFDPVTGAYKQSEMDALRMLEPADARVKDVSSTNYAHIPVVGELLYNMLEKGHQPYASSALQHMNDFIAE